MAGIIGLISLFIGVIDLAINLMEVKSPEPPPVPVKTDPNDPADGWGCRYGRSVVRLHLGSGVFSTDNSALEYYNYFQPSVALYDYRGRLIGVSESPLGKSPMTEGSMRDLVICHDKEIGAVRPEYISLTRGETSYYDPGQCLSALAVTGPDGVQTAWTGDIGSKCRDVNRSPSLTIIGNRGHRPDCMWLYWEAQAFSLHLPSFETSGEKLRQWNRDHELFCSYSARFAYYNNHGGHRKVDSPINFFYPPLSFNETDLTDVDPSRIKWWIQESQYWTSKDARNHDHDRDLLKPVGGKVSTFQFEWLGARDNEPLPERYLTYPPKVRRTMVNDTSMREASKVVQIQTSQQITPKPSNSRLKKTKYPKLAAWPLAPSGASRNIDRRNADLVALESRIRNRPLKLRVVKQEDLRAVDHCANPNAPADEDVVDEDYYCNMGVRVLYPNCKGNVLLYCFDRDSMTLMRVHKDGHSLLNEIEHKLLARSAGVSSNGMSGGDDADIAPFGRRYESVRHG